MKLEHEQQMFMTAIKWATEHVEWRKLNATWAHKYVCADIDAIEWRKLNATWAHKYLCADIVATVFSPKGSKFKHRAAVVCCCSSNAEVRGIMQEFDPTRVSVVGGHTFFYYKDGYDVLASTGALAAIRREQEG